MESLGNDTWRGWIQKHYHKKAYYLPVPFPCVLRILYIRMVYFCDIVDAGNGGLMKNDRTMVSLHIGVM